MADTLQALMAGPMRGARLSIPPDLWRTRPVVIIGGGPSVTPEDLAAVCRSRATVIAVNDAFRSIGWADACFTIDDFWLRKRVEELAGFGGELIVAVPFRFKLDPALGVVRRVERREGGPRLNPSPDVVYYGENSGHGALTFSAAQGARKIFLLGFDMKAAGHWFPPYEWQCRFGVRDYPRWIGHFRAIAPLLKSAGVDVVNLNPASGIRCFRFGNLSELDS